MTDFEILEFWYAALNAEIGVKIRTNDPTRLRKGLLRVREEAQDESLSALTILDLSPDYILICKRESFNAKT